MYVEFCACVRACVRVLVCVCVYVCICVHAGLTESSCGTLCVALVSLVDAGAEVLSLCDIESHPVDENKRTTLPPACAANHEPRCLICSHPRR